jgi:SAM-dependent methyltransferase
VKDQENIRLRARDRMKWMSDRILNLTARYAAYASSAIDDRISPGDTMTNEWYMAIGKSAAQCVVAACAASWVTQVRAVLDLPCGHGRVLRHLVKLFPEAKFDACDIDRKGVEFCAERFGAQPLVSQEDLTKVAFPRKYDVIWVGSLFTHVNRQRTQQWLAHLAASLSNTGIIVASFHGRYSYKRGGEVGYIEESRWKKIQDDYVKSGYGYDDYPPQTGNHGEWIAGSYGISLANPVITLADALHVPGTRVYSYTERGWAGHHDVLVIGKPALME